jgi:putative oxidoreductase
LPGPIAENPVPSQDSFYEIGEDSTEVLFSSAKRDGVWRQEDSAMDIALLVLRVVVGLYVAAHGAQKLFGWFGGGGVTGTAGFFGGMLGFRPAKFWVVADGLAEFGGGILMTVGLLGALGPIGVGASMVTATLVVHWPKGPLAANGGYELTLTNLAGAVAIGVAGVGRYSLDHLFGTSLPLWFSAAVAILALVGVVVSIVSRQAPALQKKPEAA